MTLIEELRDLGVNAEEGLDRVMGDQDLYDMMLGMFVDSVRDNPVSADEYDGGDIEGLIKKVHMLKGVTGNLAITPLFDAYTESLTHLRAGDTQKGKAAFQRLEPLQAKIIDCIKRHKGV